MYVCGIESHCSLNFHFPVTSDIETLTCLSSLVKWLCSYFAHLLICFLIIESGKIFNMFYIQGFFHQICDLHTFSSSVRSGLLFHFLNNFFFFFRKYVKFDETEFPRFPPDSQPLDFVFGVISKKTWLYQDNKNCLLLPRRIMVFRLTWMCMIHFRLIFTYDTKYRSKFFFFCTQVLNCSSIYYEKMVFSPLNCLWIC